ncbi:hypothetical protein [Deinococcus yunweiensis]|uniref:hypothetical protein n=1 Tax=Deinococcus yunweiensis TaxID=367282 RepID=UPI00398E7641
MNLRRGCHFELVPRLKTISFQTLLSAREKLPLRPDDRIEQLLEHFRVPFDAMRTGKGICHLQRGNLVLWFIEGVLNSVELTTGGQHEASDLVSWGGFDIRTDDLLAWCSGQDILLALRDDQEGGQLWVSPSGALIAIQNHQLWNVTLAL